MPQQRKKPEHIRQRTKEKLRERKKESKQKLKQKRARLIVKNLPFKVTEENLKEYFEKFGEVESVNVLKKEDGKLVGCGFVQFKLVQKAAKARHHTNNQPFLGRNISVDFALAKDKFKKEIKAEPQADVKVEIKDEPIDVDAIKEEETDVKDEKDVKNCDKEENSSTEDESDEDLQIEEEKPRPRVISNDVTEGKTIFVKNVPFTATNEDLKKCMLQFGPLYYALICVDKFTEHSKGTAFVKFVNKEDADKALEAGTELVLLGNILDCHPALGRNEVHQKKVTKQDEKSKDSRNLYLVKEGVVLAGTKAAEGVSISDMSKRLQLEQYKTQMLRNLNMFVSRDRLVIHNLPPTWDDKKLRTLVLKYAGKGAVIKEARIMRDMKQVDEKGVGISKEFGFVAFTKHEHALNLLRALNNNPNIFTPAKRPIVTFSIENKVMIKAKEKRLEKSKLKNPKSKQYDPQIVKKDIEKMRQKQEDNSNTEPEKYTGVTAKPGVVKMRSRYNLKTQAKLHFENFKKEKKKLKMAKKSFSEKKQEFTKQPKQKINKKKESDNFSKLVNDYKKKLTSSASLKKSKWYSE